MIVQIKGTEIELTLDIRNYAEKKVLSLQKYFDESSGEVFASVEVGKISQHHRSGSVYRAEFAINAHGKKYYASKEKDDLYAAIDEVRDEILKEIVSSKGKRETLLRKGGARIKQLIKRLSW